MVASYNRKIVVESRSIAEDLKDFPVLVEVTDDLLKAATHGGHVACEAGGDIYFTDIGGSVLAREIERYDPVEGFLRAWVRIPLLPAEADTELLLCYGGDAADTRSAVWGEDYRLVRHRADGEFAQGSICTGEELNLSDAITVEAWVHSDEGKSDAFQTLVSQWELRPEMDAFESYDAGATDGLNTKGYFGAVCDGRYVYFSPQYNGEECHGQALRYDTHGEFQNAGSWAAYDAGHTSGMETKGYYGAVHAGNHIYYIPRTDGEKPHSKVLRYDIRGDFRSAESWEAYDTGAGVSCQSAAFDGRHIYFVPGYEAEGESGKVLRYDTEGGFTDGASYATYDAKGTSGLDCRCYDGAVFDGRHVYFAPLRDGGPALRLDTEWEFSSPESWTAFDASTAGLGMCVGAIFDGRYVYYVPYAHSTAVRYDTEGDFQDAGSWSSHNASGTSGLNTRGYDGACFDGRYVYYIPFWEGEDPTCGFHARVLRYDTTRGFSDEEAWTAVDAGALTTPAHPGGFNAGAFDGRYLYFSPWREDSAVDRPSRLERWRKILPHGKVMRYDTAGAESVFTLKYAECGHNGGLCAALPGPMFTINTTAGPRSVRANRAPGPGWHHIAGVYDGARLRLYVDGEVAGEIEARGGLVKSEADIAIGGLAGGGAEFRGRIGEVRVSYVARSSAWIEASSRNLKSPGEFVRTG